METKYNHKLVNKTNIFLKTNQKKMDSDSFSILLPPPNITGKLHLGHAWNSSIQDFFIRYNSFNGVSSFLMPGMDHAGIATQAVIEKSLFKEQKLTKFDLGRKKFVDLIWEKKTYFANVIHNQWNRLGLNLAYDFEKFTLDHDVNKLVLETFVSLYEDGYIYKDYKLVNWDTKLETVVSNEEVFTKEVEQKLYQIRYQLENDKTTLIVATTRPETMFGDVALFINPDDKRYKKIINSKSTYYAINPINQQKIPILFDKYVDLEFGTGVMKCTPAHDPNDYELGKKHNLKEINTFNFNGTLNEKTGKYNGIEIIEARKMIVEDFKKQKVIENISTTVSSIGYSQRSDAQIQPMLSLQWFLKMKKIKNELVKSKLLDNLNFVPKNFLKSFTHWINKLEDWCISRQLWWGHQIPAYYNDKNEMVVSLEKPKGNWKQDEDVLDTWFSSGLWPILFDNKDNEKFQSTLLVTGYDILFFWVVRMIFLSYKLSNKLPFKYVYLHGLIRSEDGRKMSKSLGNGIDPNDVIEKYGADALRFALLTNSTPGMDIIFSNQKIKDSWNFLNKIWNSVRFLKTSESFEENDNNKIEIEKVSNYLKYEFNKFLEKFEKLVKNFELGIAGNNLYDFTWNIFCSWGIEFSKFFKSNTFNSLLKQILQKILIILNPFAPFVTTYLFKLIFNIDINTQKWPQKYSEISNKANKHFQEVGELIGLITNLRTIRKENRLKHSEKINLFLEANDFNMKNIPLENLFKFFTNVLISIGSNKNNLPVVLHKFPIYYDFSKKIDLKFKKDLLQKQKKKLISEIKRIENLFNNKSYLAKAPKSLVEKERVKLKEFKSQLKIVEESLGE